MGDIQIDGVVILSCLLSLLRNMCPLSPPPKKFKLVLESAGEEEVHVSSHECSVSVWFSAPDRYPHGVIWAFFEALQSDIKRASEDHKTMELGVHFKELQDIDTMGLQRMHVLLLTVVACEK
jgi:hypothetical protein